MCSIHRATQLFQADRAFVKCFACFQRSPRPVGPPFKSVMVYIRIFLGRPRFLCLSTGSQCSGCLADRFSSIRCECLSHRNRHSFRMFSSLVIPVLRRTSSFVIMPFQPIPSSFLSHLLSFLRRLFASVMDQVSAAIFIVLMTQTILFSF